jgi:ureidoacrylate peracid hydrolase
MKTINGVEVFDTLEEIAALPHTALVVVDMQNDFCHPEGHYGRHGKDLAAISAAVPRVVDFVTRAQDAGVFTLFIRQLTLPHGRSDSPAWLRFKCRDGKSPEYTLPGTWGSEFVDGLRPRATDVVVDKFRPDAFVRTTLDTILRSQRIQSLVVIGTATEGCVESTIRGASYHDYYVVTVPELTCSPNPVLHENSLQLVRARYPVATPAQLLSAWGAQR